MQRVNPWRMELDIGPCLLQASWVSIIGLSSTSSCWTAVYCSRTAFLLRHEYNWTYTPVCSRWDMQARLYAGIWEERSCVLSGPNLAPFPLLLLRHDKLFQIPCVPTRWGRGGGR